MLKNPNYKYGPRDKFVPIALNFGEHMLDTVLKFKDQTAFIDAATHETITYGEIAQNAINLAVSLTRIGVRKGDTIAVCSENRREYWPTVIGVLCAGAVITPVNILYTTDETRHVLGISKPKFVICSPLAHKLQEGTIRDFRFIKNTILYGDKAFSGLLYNELVKNDVKAEEFRAIDVQGQVDTAIILYSSGTTGLPKGVLLTHLNALVASSLLNKPELLHAGLILLTIAPWFHAMGMWGALGSLINGATMVYIPKFEEKLYLETIQRYKPTIAAVVPPILVLLAKTQILDQYDVSSIIIMYCGAAPVDLETINEVKKRFPNLISIQQGYGLTEATLTISSDSGDTPSGFKPGSVGPVVAGAVAKVVDLETRKPLGPNKVGEICAKGSMLMKGYLGKDTKDDYDDEGFFKTGDIGYYDDDGYFYIVDRLKELIKYKGYQVAPAEIEAELIQHPAVRDAGVIGLPNKESGELPLAFVVKMPESNVTEVEIKAFIASKLSNPKHLRGGVRFVGEIPKSQSGKILRRELKKILDYSKSKV